VVEMLGSQWILEEKQLIRFQRFCQVNGLGGRDALVCVVEQFDIVSEFLSEMLGLRRYPRMQPDPTTARAARLPRASVSAAVASTTERVASFRARRRDVPSL
jgi:hypothetical protein